MNAFVFLLLNSLLLFTPAILNIILGKSINDHKLPAKIVYGLVFSVILYLILYNPYTTANGIIYDSRTVLLGFIVLYYDPISVVIATVAAVLFRVQIGGIGVVPGVITIITTVCIGFVARYLFQKFPTKKTRFIRTWAYGFVVHLLMVLYHFFLPIPQDQIVSLILEVMPVIIIVYPVVLVLLALGFEMNETNVKVRKEHREREEQYRLLFMSVPNGIIQYDINGVIVSCNELFARFIGTTSEMLIGLRMLDLPDQNIVQIVSSSLRGEKGQYEGPYTAVTTGKKIYVNAQFSAIHDAKGIVVGGVGIVEDLTEKRMKELERVELLMASLFEKSPREKMHSERVAELAVLLGERLEFDASRLEKLRKAAVLHDIGKLNIDGTVLEKPGALTEDEYHAIKNHVQVGYRVLHTVRDYRELAEIVLHHHEFWNGKGYPDQLIENMIPLESRIIGICDAFDAMTNDRPYRKALSQVDAIEELKRNAGSQFDPDIARLFIQILEKDIID